MSTLLEMFRDAAIKAHIGFKHEGRWEECEWIECEDRKQMIDHAMMGHSWSDEFPQVEESFYWIRHKQNHADLNVGLLRDRTLLLAEGGSMSKSPRKDFEFLPASPSDFEQLAALRAVGTNALTWILKFKELDHGMFHVGAFELCREPTCLDAHRLIAALREVLGDK